VAIFERIKILFIEFFLISSMRRDIGERNTPISEIDD